jgi:hypothetical protein
MFPYLHFKIRPMTLRIFIPALGALMFSASMTAQVSFATQVETPVPKFRSVDLRTLPEADAFLTGDLQPYPGGDAYDTFLQLQKQRASTRFPERNRTQVAPRSIVEPPEVVRSFSGNGFYGIPLDNHLAVNREDLVVSVVNTHMVVTGPTGIWQENYSLDEFWSGVGETDFYFDPRIIYDPLEDRYILAMMQDFDCDGSNIVFAFSATHDPTGLWHMYRFEGCPKSDATFADFPMIALTQDELFFTYNAVYEDSSWQTGFNETLIYQINKFDGYAGDDLEWRSWSDIRHNGVRLRYICPVKYGTEEMASDLYFLSNRSFDIQNDTVFFLHINGNMDHPDLELTVMPLISDRTYGVPPNARQPMDFLQTNDARVLDAFYIDDHVQFVGNTMDTSSGRSAVYHGIITDVSTSPVLSAEILHNAAEHFAYPGIAYTGVIPGERDAIIIASHASADRFPGYSALYFNEGYSEWVAVKEGLRNIDMFKIDNPFGVDPTLERWGDYSGIQRQWNEIGTVYTSSSYGKPGNLNDTWIGYLRRPEGDPSASKDLASSASVTAFPNPASDWLTVEVEIPRPGSRLEATVYSLAGQPLGTVYEKVVNASGLMQFHYRTDSLVPGSYVLQLWLDGVPVDSKAIVIE